MSHICRIGDLNELDNLLDDLRKAKEKLTKNLSLKDELKINEQSKIQIDNSSSASSLVLQTQSESTDSYSSRDVSSKLFDTNFQFGDLIDTKRYTNYLNTSDEMNRYNNFSLWLIFFIRAIVLFKFQQVRMFRLRKRTLKKNSKISC
jgi:hypothetical protein